MRPQAGFTLLELLVVVLIISVLLSAGTLALRPSEQMRLTQALAQARVWLQSSCDQAAFSGTLVAIVPETGGLSAFQLASGRWVLLEKGFRWPQGAQAQWRGVRAMPEGLPALSAPAWLCWPEGEMTPGALRLQGEAASGRLRWDEWGRFKLEGA